MNVFIGEFIGTMLLIILGNGVVANVLLNKTKGQNSGLIVIAFGWAIGVFVGVYASLKLGGSGHLNPAVTLALAYLEEFPRQNVLTYILAQLSGAIAGAIIMWLAYRQHFQQTQDGDAKLAVFCTGPAIRSTPNNIITEIIGTFVLMLGALLFIKPENSLGTLEALPVALLVLGIGVSLGGPTGYAINPARDLGPRIAHFILPIPQKRNSDWTYSWIPIIGPIVGALLAAMVFKYFLS
ncbi:aquaporin family protein [Paraflavitalea soli]|uniref:Aquaporin family protein n=1 Tax=Paraflavitalea soli TaxID=2315862 RepID=A0A3B7MQ13_9BACT|nr:MIP/aquaporin family protein [Paraflavitalea soli]AXY76238.1 aquaporin family protein [Paraflavitalea soli]